MGGWGERGWDGKGESVWVRRGEGVTSVYPGAVGSGAYLMMVKW